MKIIENFLKINRLSRLAVLLLMMVVGTNVFAMRMTPKQMEVAKKMIRKQQNQPKEREDEKIKSELIASHWSQEKIKEFRQKRDSKGELMYPVHYTITQQDTPDQKKFNDLLINHYYQRMYEALQAIPVNERAAWAEELHFILFIGLDSFLKGGRKLFEQGRLGMIQSADDGLEMGVLGTKYAALKKIREETNNFEIIPFSGGSKVTPVEFFEKIRKPDLSQEIKEMAPEIKIIQEQRGQQKLLSSSELAQEQEKAFMSEEGLLELARREQYEDGKCLIYQKGTSKGILVDKDFLNNYCIFVKNMTEGMGSTPDEIGLDFSLDVIKVVFGQSALQKLSWDQLVKVIKCSDYLLLQYDEKDNKPPKVFVDSACYWINSIGNKLTDLGIEMARFERSSEAIEKDLPDYSVFKSLKDSVLFKAIKSKLFSDNRYEVLKRYVRMYNNLHGYGPYTQGRDLMITVQKAFGTKDSIVDLLDVIFNFVQQGKGTNQYKQVMQQQEREKAEEAKKWFWQRKSWW